MNEEKLSSDQVPQKFAEWLLSMGCPSEKVPTIDKLGDMCRGQYYMVWRSLMEHVKPKDSIRSKRLQVFVNDIQRCQKRNAFCKADSSVVEPEELTLWKQQTELRERLEAAEVRVMQAKQECNHLVDKVSTKLSQRNLARNRVANAQRRAWLLQQVSDELGTKKANLLETRSIADALCHIDENVDIESKLDKCTKNRHQVSRVHSASVSGNTLQSSLTSNSGDLNDSEEYISLVKCSGGSLWPLLCERRAALTAALNITTEPDRNTDNKGVSPQRVLAHTAWLHSSLALGALKHRAHIEQQKKRFANALTLLSEHTSGEACELLVVRCEQACAHARVATLRSLVDDVTGRQDRFATIDDGPTPSLNGKQISVIDKAIENKRDELFKVIESLSLTERKIQNVRECLINVFNSFHNESNADTDRFGRQLSLPQDSIPSLRRFYEEKREKHRNKMELSLDFDKSENCSYDVTDNQQPKFVDELRIYLKKFNLENNRKLVLESGEKIWIFETIQSSIDRLHSRLQDNDLYCSLVCPSASLHRNLQQAILLTHRREELNMLLKQLEGRQRSYIVTDITLQKEEEQRTLDIIKKRLNENLLSLQKTIKTLDLGQENLKLWNENQMRKYISTNRKIDGRTYKEYESYYVENLNLNI